MWLQWHGHAIVQRSRGIGFIIVLAQATRCIHPLTPLRLNRIHLFRCLSKQSSRVPSCGMAAQKAPWSLWLVGMTVHSSMPTAISLKTDGALAVPEAAQRAAGTTAATSTCTQFASEANSNANDWATKCSEVPTSADHIKVVMGTVEDYFKPVTGYTVCDMLTSYTKHQWSNDQVSWVTPVYYHGHLGGSQWGWPASNVAGDTRTYPVACGKPRHRASAAAHQEGG